MFVWAFLESIVWPVIPDVLLILLVVSRPGRAHHTLAACIVGSALGAALLYGLAWSFPAEASRALPYLPLAFEVDIQAVQARIARDGAFALLGQPVSGIPFKVWGIVSATSGVPPVFALPIAIVARAFRMTAFAILTGLLGARFEHAIRNYWLVVLPLYLAIFLVGWIRTFPSGW
jgi:membrane protein YqaA with SNARE-associated domain